jgi:hypothetical protein
MWLSEPGMTSPESEQRWKYFSFTHKKGGIWSPHSMKKS